MATLSTVPNIHDYCGTGIYPRISHNGSSGWAINIVFSREERTEHCRRFCVVAGRAIGVDLRCPARTRVLPVSFNASPPADPNLTNPNRFETDDKNTVGTAH